MRVFYFEHLYKLKVGLTISLGLLFYTFGLAQSESMNQSLAYCTFLNTQPVLQKGSLRGRIVNQSQEPVPNIKVMVAELGVYTYTNAQGEYAFCNFPEGQYTVIFDDGKVQKILCPLKMPKNLIYNIEW